MDLVFDVIEKAANKTSDVIDYINTTKLLSYLYQSHIWNNLRRKLTHTTDVDEILSISDQCLYDPKSDFYCSHLVRYKYNGIEQEEIFSSQAILKLCKKTGYPATFHFSLEELIKSEITKQPD